MLPLLADVGIGCAAIVAMVAAASTPPVRWLLVTLVGKPFTAWLTFLVYVAIDDKINGGIEAVHTRLTRLEEARGLEPMRYTRTPGGQQF